MGRTTISFGFIDSNRYMSAKDDFQLSTLDGMVDIVVDSVDAATKDGNEGGEYLGNVKLIGYVSRLLKELQHIMKGKRTMVPTSICGVIKFKYIFEPITKNEQPFIECAAYYSGSKPGAKVLYPKNEFYLDMFKAAHDFIMSLKSRGFPFDCIERDLVPPYKAAVTAALNQKIVSKKDLEDYQLINTGIYVDKDFYSIIENSQITFDR